MSYEDRCEISELVGKTCTAVRVVDKERVEFECNDGSAYVLLHNGDCCESVEVESVVGELDNLVGVPILMADESSNSNEDPADYPKREYPAESFTWTFYKFGTIKGYVDIRWLGESNGYYSEGVDFERTAKPRSVISP